MASKILNVRMDEELHASFKEFCKSVHIPASTLMAAFAAQTVNLGRIPFDIGATSGVGSAPGVAGAAAAIGVTDPATLVSREPAASPAEAVQQESFEVAPAPRHAAVPAVPDTIEPRRENMRPAAHAAAPDPRTIVSTETWDSQGPTGVKRILEALDNVV